MQQYRFTLKSPPVDAGRNKGISSSGIRVAITIVVVCLVIAGIVGQEVLRLAGEWIKEQSLLIGGIALAMVIVLLVNIFLGGRKGQDSLVFKEKSIEGLPMTSLGDNWDAVKSVNLYNQLLKINFADGSMWQQEVHPTDFDATEFEAFCWAQIAVAQRGEP